MPTGRGDRAFVRYLSESGYHPRSSAHGDALCRLVLSDLLEMCAPLSQMAGRGQLVYKLNFTVNPESHLRWNIDMVLGPPTSAAQSTMSLHGTIAEGMPRVVWIALDAKTVMTEHGKARRNRQRDFNAMHDILHRSNPRAVVGGLLVVNMADRFHSPLRGDAITVHRNIERLVGETIEMFQELPRSPSPEGGAGLDAVGLIVVEHTNVPGEESVLVTRSPAPQPGDAMHYEQFLRDLCAAFQARFAG